MGPSLTRSWSNRLLDLVLRLAYNDDVAAGSAAADFQRGPSRTGGNEAPISGFIRVDPPRRRKNSQPAAARRVALKMGRRPRDVGKASSLCSPGKKQSETLRLHRLAGGPF